MGGQDRNHQMNMCHPARGGSYSKQAVTFARILWKVGDYKLEQLGKGTAGREPSQEPGQVGCTESMLGMGAGWLEDQMCILEIPL